jgi:hypothetical protein
MNTSEQAEGDTHKVRNKCDCCWCDDCVRELVELWTSPVEGWDDLIKDKSV